MCTQCAGRCGPPNSAARAALGEALGEALGQAETDRAERLNEVCCEAKYIILVVCLLKHHCDAVEGGGETRGISCQHVYAAAYSCHSCRSSVAQRLSCDSPDSTGAGQTDGGTGRRGEEEDGWSGERERGQSVCVGLPMPPAPTVRTSRMGCLPARGMQRTLEGDGKVSPFAGI